MSIDEEEFNSSKLLLKKGKAEEFWGSYRQDELDLTRVYPNTKAKSKHKKGNTLLHWICKYNRYDLLNEVKDKLTTKAIDVVNEAGWTPLAMACRYGARECFEMLEKHGAKVNLRLGWGSPLILACQSKSIEIVKKICSLVADKDYINYIDDHGVSALYMSIYTGADDIFFYLIEQGASIKLAIPPHNGTMLHAACELERIKIIEYLLDSGLSLNTQDDKGNTPLHLLCAETEDVKLVRSMLSRGGDFSILNKEGEDVHNYTLEHDNAFIAEFLEKLLPSSKSATDKHSSSVKWVKLGAFLIIMFAILYQFHFK